MWLNGGLGSGKLVRLFVKEVQRYVVLLHGGLDSGKLVRLFKEVQSMLCC